LAKKASAAIAGAKKRHQAKKAGQAHSPGQGHHERLAARRPSHKGQNTACLSSGPRCPPPSPQGPKPRLALSRFPWPVCPVKPLAQEGHGHGEKLGPVPH
jgi:hypothetical protein